MPDLHQVVDQIRAFVQSSDQTRSALLDGLASAYAETCAEVNQRLGRCQRLLQNGLRSEAIQLAESEPKLLIASAALDFPERASWDELIAMYGLTPAARIQVEAAQLLNAAYAEQEPLEDLLRTHRRLALQRAPLRARISTIRQLAALDPKNTMWVDDLRTFEQARFREIQTDAAESVRKGDAAQLARFISELQGQSWVEPPPKGLAQRLAKADAELRGQQARAALSAVENRLSNAFTARDPILGRTARGDWEKLKSDAALEHVDPIWDRVRPIFDWLDAEDRQDQAERDHTAALTALVRLLDKPGHVPPAALERAARNVLGHGRGMPEDLQRRYGTRVQSAGTSQTRRFRIIAGASAAATLVAAGLLVYLGRSQMRAGEAAQAATRLNALANDEYWERAAEFIQNIEKTNPELLNFPYLIEARERYQALQKQENDRKSRFEMALREADDAPLTELNPPAILRARTERRRSATGQAEDEQAIRELLARRQAKREHEQSSSDAVVAPLLDRAARDIDRARQGLEADATDRVESRDAIDQARLRLDEVTSRLTLASDQLQKRASSLREELKQEELRLDMLERKERLEREISETISYSLGDAKRDLVGFASRLEDYVKQFPQEPESENIRRSLKEQHLWHAIDAWNLLAADWKNDRGKLAPEEAKLRAERCGRFLAEHPSFPDAASVAAYQRFADAIGRRAAGKKSPAGKLRGLLTDVLIDNVTMLTVSANEGSGKPEKRYYGTETGRDEYLIRFKSIVSIGGRELPREFNRHAALAVRSPQSLIADRFKPDLSDAAKVADWEPLIIDLFDAILHESMIDPILQVMMLRKVIEAGSEGSEPLRELLDDRKTELARFAEGVNVAWMNPDDEKVDPKRKLAAEFIKKIPDLDQKRKQIIERRQRIEQSVRRVYRSVGWLNRDSQGWHLRYVVLPRQGELMVVVAAAGQSVGEWKKVGEITDGEFAASGNSALAEGRPVFIEAAW
ncbi:MAG: hypothetical protein ACLQIB_13435 [Isosphaeraceae bacterium]